MFVADEIPLTLRRLIEYLNERLGVREVVGIELTHFACGDRVAYVPTVIGRTERAKTQKAAAGSPRSVDEYFNFVASSQRPKKVDEDKGGDALLSNLQWLRSWADNESRLTLSVTPAKSNPRLVFSSGKREIMGVQADGGVYLNTGPLELERKDTLRMLLADAGLEFPESAAKSAGKLYRVSPRQMGGNVLYLDFDGAVQPHSVYWLRGLGPCLMNQPGHALFECCPLLERELAPYPKLRIVLSTSWVVHYKGSVRYLASRLGPGLAGRVVGATFHSKMNAMEFRDTPRGLQIWSDVCRRRPRCWLALDDDDEGWPTWCRDRLVRTDPVWGIASQPVLGELRFGLQEMHWR